ncbi:MAG: aminotransferase class V-fold PLP-dependent enzyme [Chloroflexi bacterium]|nr:aminotransferase class V-fold PLP-dependent enzyme [Chloroflexota bacterium]
MPALLSAKTRLVAITYASNAVGSITDVKRAMQIIHEAGAFHVDAPLHFLRRTLSLMCGKRIAISGGSVYKFFGGGDGGRSMANMAC